MIQTCLHNYKTLSQVQSVSSSLNSCPSNSTSGQNRLFCKNRLWQIIFISLKSPVNTGTLNYSMCVFLCMSFPMDAYRVYLKSKAPYCTVAAAFCLFITCISSYVCRWQSHMGPLNVKPVPLHDGESFHSSLWLFPTLWCSLAPVASSYTGYCNVKRKRFKVLNVWRLLL